MKTAVKKMSLAALVAFSMAAVNACSGSSNAGDSAKDNIDDRGPITFVAGKDNPGYVQPLLDRWNDSHPDERVTFRELTDSADQQREDMVQNLNSKADNYDVMSLDIIWTAEFAAKRWLVPLEDSMEVNTEGILPNAIEGAKYDDRLMAMPHAADGGLLFYRTDLVDKAPETWEEMMDLCSKAEEKEIDCYGGQLDQYEGLTTNFIEQVNNEGGRILNSEGRPEVKTPEVVRGLNNLVEAIKNGHIDRKVLSWKEEQGRNDFQQGKLMFLRNWPYIYDGLNNDDGSSQISGKFAMAPLPGKEKGPGKSALGGHNLGISSYSKHKATAKDFVEWVANPEQQKFITSVSASAPVVASLYKDPDLVKKFPYFSSLKLSIDNALPRPVTPFYSAVTKGIQDNAYAALKGDKTPEQAIDDMQVALESAVKE